ncbi:MAG: hypothetical protein U0Q55_22095 [Vicinamibacterales bacterium]
MLSQELTTVLWDIQAQLELQVRLVDRARLELADHSRHGPDSSPAEVHRRLTESVSALSRQHRVIEDLLAQVKRLATALGEQDTRT